MIVTRGQIGFEMVRKRVQIGESGDIWDAARAQYLVIEMVGECVGVTLIISLHCRSPCSMR